MTARIAVRNLWKEYGDQVVLERINLSVAAGEFCTIVGASGCGKTTFLRLLLGEETQTRGEILLDGEPLPAEPGPDRGIVFQRYSVFPHLSVLRNVMLGLELKAAPVTGRLFGAARREARDQAREMLEAVGLAGRTGPNRIFPSQHVVALDSGQRLAGRVLSRLTAPWRRPGV